MKYYLIAGEASGDLHASNLIKEIKKQDQQASFRVWGGDKMEAEGAHLVKHYRDLAFMGFAEVVKNLPTIFANIKFCKQDILLWQPDVIVFIDYPGFNMRIAQFAKLHGFKTVYYISPQVWAWKQNRVLKLKRDIDLMLTILPFEQDFYKKWNWNVEFVGHPLLDALPQNHQQEAVNKKPLVALLPGSRKQEIALMLPIMLEACKALPDCTLAVAAAPSISKEFYQRIFREFPNIDLRTNQTYQLLQQADAAMVTSGTATLETALIGTPEVVCYKGSRISYEIAKRLIKVKYISLVNLIMDKLIVKELIQQELNPANLATEISKLLYDKDYRTKMLANYQNLKEKLGNSGASAKAAAAIVGFGKKVKA